MTRPFQYDNFVQSQIAMVNGSNVQFGSGVRKNQDHSRNPNQTGRSKQSRLALKNKINELLGICREENDGIKNQFKQVIGAQKEILDLMKEELEQPPSFNTYARSNVEMFPGTHQTTSVGPGLGYQGYAQQPKSRSNQTFPLGSRSGYGNQYHPQSYQPQAYQLQQQHLHPSTGYYNQSEPYVTDYTSTHLNPNIPSANFGGYGNYDSSSFVPNDRTNIGIDYTTNPNFPSSNYGPGYGPSYGAGYGHSDYTMASPNIPNSGYGNYGYSSGYAPNVGGGEYTSTNPNIPGSTYGYASGQTPNDRTNILKSKIHELKEENSRLRNIASQPNLPKQQPQEDDLQIRQLQQEVLRLRGIVQDYENQIAALSNNPATNQKASLLRRLKDQGEKIRQDTLALLRGKSSLGYENVAYQSEQVYQGQPGVGSYGYSSGAPQLISSQHRGISGLSPEQQAQFRAQLNELRIQCQQLQHENASIKRANKGNAPGSRRY